METTLIIFIVGLAFAYLLRRFLRSLQSPGDPECGCSCTSCPGNEEGRKTCKSVNHIK